MINNLNILLPEIFLTLSIFSLLMIGVFLKNSFNLIFNLSSIIIIMTTAIIFNRPNIEEKIFLESFTRDAFSNFFKILILISSLFVLNTSKNYIIDKKLDKFEYPIIILLSILGMFFMVSSNDIIVFYLGLELQSLSLYILASIDRDNLKSSESGLSVSNDDKYSQMYLFSLQFTRISSVIPDMIIVFLCATSCIAIFIPYTFTKKSLEDRDKSKHSN